MRYTLHYLHEIKCGDSWYPDYIPRWEQMDFKTLKEAKDYLSIAGGGAYIIDNVTNICIWNLDLRKKEKNDKQRKSNPIIAESV